MSEKKVFQPRFLMVGKELGFNIYRTAILSSPGFPDTQILEETHYSLVELKAFKSLNIKKTLEGAFTKDQPPWYINYTKRGGKRLFIAFKFSSTRYGVLYVTFEIAKKLIFMTYEQMFDLKEYEEFRTIKGVILHVSKFEPNGVNQP